MDEVKRDKPLSSEEMLREARANLAKDGVDSELPVETDPPAESAPPAVVEPPDPESTEPRRVIADTPDSVEPDNVGRPSAHRLERDRGASPASMEASRERGRAAPPSCPSCGAWVASSRAQFCSSCGSRLGEAPSPIRPSETRSYETPTPPTAPPSPAAGSTRTRPGGVGYAVAVAVFAALVFVPFIGIPAVIVVALISADRRRRTGRRSALGPLTTIGIGLFVVWAAMALAVGLFFWLFVCDGSGYC